MNAATAADFYVRLAAWSQIVSSILFIAVMVWLWVRFIQPAIMGAQDRANKSIAEAERHRDEAKATLDLLQGEKAGAQRDAELIERRTSDRARREYDAAVAEATEIGERALANAQGEFERAVASARAQLRDELLAKALARAREKAKRRIDATADARLVDRFVASLESSAPDRFEVSQ